MSDTLTPSQRSYNMSRIRSRNTTPERAVRHALWNKGYRYRLNDKRLPGSPDLVLPKYRAVIFINGCFWHGHRGCTKYVEPKTNAGFWKEKIARNIARRIVSALTAQGYDAELLVPEEEDISLQERCRRVNTWCRQLGKDNVILISIHINAAGRGGRWMDARGWCAYTTRGNTRADRLATCLYNAASHHLPGMRLRTDYTDGDPDLEKNFYILLHTAAPAVLSESLFMDNQADCDFLLIAEGQQSLVDLHVEGITNYLAE